MSGRSTWLREDEHGHPELVRGFRKTNRRNPRRLPCGVMVEQRRSSATTPEQVLRFRLRDTLSFALAPGPIPGLIGVTAENHGWITVRGRDRGFLCQQAAAVIKRQAKDRPAGRIEATLTCDGKTEEFEIVYGSGQPFVAISGYSMRPFFADG